LDTDTVYRECAGQRTAFKLTWVGVTYCFDKPKLMGQTSWKVSVRLISRRLAEY